MEKKNDQKDRSELFISSQIMMVISYTIFSIILIGETFVMDWEKWAVVLIAGGVAVSGLEMTQNSMRVYWTAEEVDTYLKRIMNNIHESCLTHAAQFGATGNYVAGANIAGFIKVADSMIDQGLV